MRACLALLLAVTIAPAPAQATFEVEGFRQGTERRQAELLAIQKGFSVSQIDDDNIHICKSKDYCFTLAFCMDHLSFVAYNVEGGTAAFARIAEQNLAKFGQPTKRRTWSSFRLEPPRSAADLLHHAIGEVLAGGLRTADIMQGGMARVSTSWANRSCANSTKRPHDHSPVEIACTARLTRLCKRQTSF